MRGALDYRKLLFVPTCRAGGDIVRRSFGGHLEAVREKSPGDWVSEADLASEQAIRELLTRDSGLPVYGEEAGGDDFDTGWLVDPLDGTANFVHGFDAVGVSVGLIEDGVPVVGVVHAPLLDRTRLMARWSWQRSIADCANWRRLSKAWRPDDPSCWSWRICIGAMQKPSTW